MSEGTFSDIATKLFDDIIIITVSLLTDKPGNKVDV